MCFLIIVILLLRFGPTLAEPLAYNDTTESVYLVTKVLPEHHSPADIYYWFGHRWPMYEASNYYRPIAMASFVLDWHLWGENAFGYRLTSLVLLICCAISLGALAHQVMGKVGWLVGVIWALAPRDLENLYLFTPPKPLFMIQNTTTTWIMARPDLLAALFALVAFWLFYQPTKSFWLGLGVYLLALLSKESALPLAVVASIAIGLDERIDWKKKLGRMAGIWAVLGGYMALRDYALGVGLLEQGGVFAHNTRTILNPVVEYLLGPAIRTSNIIIFPHHTLIGLFVRPGLTLLAIAQGIFYVGSLFLLLRYARKQLLIWAAWAVTSVLLIVHLPVFFAWPHYWFMGSFASPFLLLIALKTFWEQIIEPRLKAETNVAAHLLSPQK